MLVEPNVDVLPEKLTGQMLISAEQAYERADIHVLLVDHKQFKVDGPTKGYVVDTKGIWN